MISFSLIAITGVSIAACIIVMTTNPKPEIFISLIFPLALGFMFYCVGRNINIYVIINISYTLGTIIIEKKRMFHCYNKQEIIQINEVKELIIEDQEGLFNLKFKLSDGKYVYGLNEMYDNGEGKKVLEIMKNALPERISLVDNLSPKQTNIDLKT